MNESDVTRQIRDVLRACRVWHFKQWQGLGSFKGAADIIGIHAGRFLAIEVKAPNWKAPGPYSKGYKHYREQLDFLEAVQENGGIGFFATNVETVIRELDLNVLPLFGKR